MQIFEGIAVSPGVAIGEAIVIDNEGFRIPRQSISPSAVDAELARIQNLFVVCSILHYVVTRPQ